MYIYFNIQFECHAYKPPVSIQITQIGRWDNPVVIVHSKTSRRQETPDKRPRTINADHLPS